MHMRNISFTEGEYYHIYNRGVDKRNIFVNNEDHVRFLLGMKEFNVLDPIGSIYENSFIKELPGHKIHKQKPLVNFIAFCLNPNHYHFILQQATEKGIEKYMHRLGTGYTKYFNNKYKRGGVLFQGKFKAINIDSNEYLLRLSAYINLNYLVHKLGSSASKSSWNEYIATQKGICNKRIILNQFKNVDEYKNFATDSLKDILERKQSDKELKAMLFE